MLGGCGICRILTMGDFESAVKIIEPLPRTLFNASAICGFVAKIRLCSASLDFSRTSEIRGPAKRVLATLAASAQHPVVTETSKGRCRKTEQRPFFVIASRRVRNGCITENILQRRLSTQLGDNQTRSKNAIRALS